MAIERQQNLRYSTRQKLAANYTLSGLEIRDGIHVIGSAAEGICPSCGEASPCFTCDTAN